MILEALEAKSRATGTRYSMRDLAADTDMDIAHVSRVARGIRPATPEILGAWARALDPYSPLDAALVEAGYAPADPITRTALQRLVRLPADARRRVLEELGRFTLEPGEPRSDQSTEQDGDKQQ